MAIKGDGKLAKICRRIIRHERFDPIRHKTISIGWCKPDVGWEDTWAWCDIDKVQIRLNSSIKLIPNVPDLIIEYLVAHELIHLLPGCGPHNNTFWDHEITVVGDDYYEAVKWMRIHKEDLLRPYFYRDPVWMRKRIDIDQLRTKDIAEICGCSERTIQKWLKRHGMVVIKT